MIMSFKNFLLSENLTIPQNVNDKIEVELYKKLERNSLNESINEGTKTAETASDKFEVKTTNNIKKFLTSQESPYNQLEVIHYDESDRKYHSDIRITNPKTEKEIWIEAKKEKYANFGSTSYKYTDGKWTCSTLEDNDPLLSSYIDILTENATPFIDFCKSYLKKDDISLPKDLTKDLVEAWKKTGSIEDTDNNTQFITNKIPLDEFGFKVAEFYKFSKQEPVYYIQSGDDLYIIDPNYNPLDLRCKDGSDLKPLSEAYKKGRIQFRLKGQEKIKGGKKTNYYSIFQDVKILADKDNVDEEYSCSFNDEEKWPIIGNSKNTPNKNDKKINESALDDVVNDEKRIPSTNKNNPDRKEIPSNGETLTLTSSLDGRIFLVDVEGYTLRRDDNKELRFDSPEDAIEWAEVRGYKVEKDFEHKNFSDIDEAEDNRVYAYHVSNVPPEKIKSEGFKAGLGNGGTENNLLQDLYDLDYPKNYLFISKQPWDTERNVKFKYCYKIDITDIDLYPDFGMLIDNGAYYEDNGDDYLFYWRDKDIQFMKNKTFKEFLEKQNGEMTVNQMIGGETQNGDYFPDALYDALGSAVIDADKVNKENRIVDVVVRDEVKEAEKDIGGEKSDTIPTEGIKIWIDDIREAPKGFIWFKTVNTFINWCYKRQDFSDVTLIDTDHDAGDYQSEGGDYIKIFDYLDFCGVKNVTIHIHSSNPVGANNIRNIISRNKENGWKEIRNTSKL